MSPNLKKRIHLFGGTIFIFVLLAVLLGFYFFKYIPERRTAFNRNAFLELDQIEDALQVKDQAYRAAIRMILHQEIVNTDALLKFDYKSGSGVQFSKEYQIGQTRSEWHDSTS